MLHIHAILLINKKNNGLLTKKGKATKDQVLDYDDDRNTNNNNKIREINYRTSKSETIYQEQFQKPTKRHNWHSINSTATFKQMDSKLEQ